MKWILLLLIVLAGCSVALTQEQLADLNTVYEKEVVLNQTLTNLVQRFPEFQAITTIQQENINTLEKLYAKNVPKLDSRSSVPLFTSIKDACATVQTMIAQNQEAYGSIDSIITKDLQPLILPCS
ncbi:MAG: glutathionyl-hydroquinone reductase [Candidatus Woesearchaeota archaeon]|jgi:glutathionyl-hydroquinone reductase